MHIRPDVGERELSQIIFSQLISGDLNLFEEISYLSVGIFVLTLIKKLGMAIEPPSLGLTWVAHPSTNCSQRCLTSVIDRALAFQLSQLS